MRLHYYQFPKGTHESVLLSNGCAIILKNGETVYAGSIPDDKRDLVDWIDDTISCSVSFAKKMLRQYGGTAWTDHCERDGGVFEKTEITIKGNNSQFRYNRHL